VLRSNAFPGAADYDVSVGEIDGTVVWRERSIDSVAALPPSVAAHLAAGKTMTWVVVARDRSGATIAKSGIQHFNSRVVPR